MTADLNHLASGINAVDLKLQLRDIQPDRRNPLQRSPPSSLSRGSYSGEAESRPRHHLKTVRF